MAKMWGKKWVTSQRDVPFEWGNHFVAGPLFGANVATEPSIFLLKRVTRGLGGLGRFYAVKSQFSHFWVVKPVDLYEIGKGVPL